MRGHGREDFETGPIGRSGTSPELPRKPTPRRKQVGKSVYWFTKAGGETYFGNVEDVPDDEARRLFAGHIKTLAEDGAGSKRKALTAGELIDLFLDWLQKNRSDRTYSTHRTYCSRFAAFRVGQADRGPAREQNQEFGHGSLARLPGRPGPFYPPTGLPAPPAFPATPGRLAVLTRQTAGASGLRPAAPSPEKAPRCVMWKMLAPVLVALVLLPPAPAGALWPGHPCVVETVEIEGKLGWHGNYFSRLPDGRIISTTMGCEWEGYFVESGGKTYILDLPQGHEGAERLKGKRVLVAGVLDHRTVGFPDRQYEMPFIRINNLVSSAPVEIKGKLAFDPTEIWRPFGVYWYISSGDQRFYLDFGKNTEVEKLASTLQGTVVVTGRLEVSRLWQIVHVATLKAEEPLVERAYEGNWEKADTILALKSGDRRPLVEHVRDMLAEDLKAGGHTLRLESGRLVVRTTAANHAKIERFLHLLAVIPGPAR